MFSLNYYRHMLGVCLGIYAIQRIKLLVRLMMRLVWVFLNAIFTYSSLVITNKEYYLNFFNYM